ncbi:MAG: zf-HC2 domain-containing protein [bacterium]|nr:zf-HC2 domain-containing protein [bacterium]
MDCKQVEDLLSEYIENELSPEVYKEVTVHMERCLSCSVIKRQMEEMLYSFSDLEEEVPFFLRNRLFCVPESQENIVRIEEPQGYLKWVAAIIGIFALFLNVFYHSNIFPPANRMLHTVVSEIKVLAVQGEAFYEKVKESKSVLFFSPSAETDGVAVKDKTDNRRERMKRVRPTLSNDKKTQLFSMENRSNKNGAKNG